MPSAPQWEDPTTYQWRIRSRGIVLWSLLSVIAVPAVVFRIFEFGQRLIPVAFTWLVPLLGALLGITVLVSVVQNFLGTAAEAEKRRPLIYWVSMVTAGCLLFVMADSDGWLHDHFSRDISVRFYVDNLLRVALLDIPEIWDWSLSHCVPKDGVAKAFVFSLRLFLTLGLVELGLQVIRTQWRGGIAFQGTVQDAYHRLESLPWGEFTLQRCAVVSTESTEGQWQQKEFLELFSEQAES